MRLNKIISGGQTGVDRAALDAALEAGFPCGGWCPEGRKAEDGPIPDHYPVEVLSGAGYRKRTIQNLLDSDGTVIFSFGEPVGGTALTLAQCIRLLRPHLVINSCAMSTTCAAGLIRSFVEEHQVEVLNVAGPSEGRVPGAAAYTCEVLMIVLLATRVGNGVETCE